MFINDCHGRFTDETAARLPVATDQTAGFLTGDLDRDGDTDIVVLDRGQDRILINTGGGFFVDDTATRLPAVADSARDGALADMNGDGTLDIVTSNSRGQIPRLYLNDGRHLREEPVDYVEAADETDTALALVDLNGDRFPDVYIANAGRFDADHGFGGGPAHFFENHHGHLREATAAHATFPTDLGFYQGIGIADAGFGGRGQAQRWPADMFTSCDARRVSPEGRC